MTNKELWEIANRERLWMTAEEFYAHIEAHKAARLKEIRSLPKPFKPGSFVREYRLWDGNWTFKPKVKAPIAPKPEVMP
jgi:hypothetical protein